MQVKLWLAGLALIACWGCGTPMDAPAPEPPPARAEVFTEPEPLDENDDRLFRRLKSHIDRRVEERLVSGMDEAAGVKKSGFGSALAGAIGKVVKVVLLAILKAVLVAVLLALLWHYLGWVLAIVCAWLGFSALAGYLGGRHAVKKGSAGGSQPVAEQPASPARALVGANPVHSPQQPGGGGGDQVGVPLLPPAA